MGRTKKEDKIEKEVSESIIGPELQRYENKIKDFQNFIEEPTNNANASNQLKFMKELPALLKNLAILRSLKTDNITNDVRGDLNLSLVETGQI